MENKKLSTEAQTDPMSLLKFKAANGFVIVLQFKGSEDLKVKQDEIKSAGLECQQLSKFNPIFDSADFFIDMRNPGFVANFDVEDWV